MRSTWLARFNNKIPGWYNDASGNKCFFSQMYNSYQQAIVPALRGVIRDINCNKGKLIAILPGAVKTTQGEICRVFQLHVLYAEKTY